MLVADLAAIGPIQVTVVAAVAMAAGEAVGISVPL